MTDLYLVRHGPTHQKNFVGWRDVPADLSDTAALSRLSAFLPSDALLISSDLLRARTTADAISGNRRRLPHDARLREFNFGAWDGLHFSEVAQRDPDLSRRFWEEPGDIKAPDGESWNTVANRVSGAIDELISAYPKQPLIVVAHIGVIMTQIARAQGRGAYAAMGHEIDNLSVTQTKWTGTEWRLGPINHKP